MSEEPNINRQYFDAMYEDSNDPWNFAGSAYEQEKYKHTISALEGKYFSNALEIGCSIGILTEQLAPSCSFLLGVDISEKPIAIARERLKERKGIQFGVFAIPGEYPEGKYDLIMLSEVAYYLSKEDLELTRELIFDSLNSGGTLCLVNWRAQIEGCAFNGDEISRIFTGDTAYINTYQDIQDNYRIDVMMKP
jgi:predicted TPR repeat methyltransferase